MKTITELSGHLIARYRIRASEFLNSPSDTYSTLAKRLRGLTLANRKQKPMRSFKQFVKGQ